MVIQMLDYMDAEGKRCTQLCYFNSFFSYGGGMNSGYNGYSNGGYNGYPSGGYSNGGKFLAQTQNSQSQF
jgi:hypothetical protein